MTEPETGSLRVPGAVLHYDVRAVDSSDHPVLLIIGSPMGTAGFVTLAGHFTDRTVVTYDPRGTGRSQRTDDALETRPEEHADDLRRLISALEAGPADIFASSGGAVNALVLVARHPGQVQTLVAHEPPAFSALPDRGPVLAACVDIKETYQRSGFGPAMAKFMAMISYQGPVPADYAGQPAPDPAVFGLPTEDDGTRNDPLVGQNMPSSAQYEHDFGALRAAPTRIVVGVGEESRECVTGRAGTAVAQRLGTAPVIFPGGHDGFLGGEFGRVGKPDEFAATLRGVLGGQQGLSTREQSRAGLGCIPCNDAVSATLDEMQPFSEATMTSPSAVAVTEPPVSLRERKKLATRRLLRRAALILVAERGLSNVTVEDIAEAADVSPRTFFNYFPSKEAVLFGGDPDRAAILRDRLASEAPGAPALDVLRVVLAQDAEAVTDELRSLGGDPAAWLRRMKVARTDPQVRAAHAAQMALLERAIAEGLAARLGADQETDPYPSVLAAAAVGVLRACMAFWAGSGGAVQLRLLIDQAFRALADGLPEHGALRGVTTRKDEN